LLISAAFAAMAEAGECGRVKISRADLPEKISHFTGPPEPPRFADF
jgi:hypothetical protein